MFVRPWTILTVLLAGSMIATLAGCGGQSSGTQSAADTTKPEAEVPTPVETTSEAPVESEAPTEEEKEVAETTDEPQAEQDSSNTLVETSGITFSAPADWELSPNPVFVEAELTLPGEEGPARMTIMPAGGDKDSNIQRWVGQFQREPGEEPSISEIEVDSGTATQVDIRGKFSDQLPGKTPIENARMLAFIIPFNATHNYFVKVTGPKSTIGQHEEAILEFVKTGKRK